MSDSLKAILLTNLKNSPDFIRYFPNNNGDLYKNHLEIIANSIKQYGNGYLQNKNIIYYYKTFTFQESNIVLFCLIYFELPYKRKYVEKLTEEIYELITKQITSINNILDNNTSKVINKLFYKYASIDKNKIEMNEDNSMKDLDIGNLINKKNIYNRVDNEGEKNEKEFGKTFSNIPNETELTFLYNGRNIGNIIKLLRWKKFKRKCLISFIILDVLLFGLLGVYIYYLINISNS